MSKKKTKERRYSFPTVSRCPRCGVTQTRATSTQGRVQYRKCLAPICGKSYTVFGEEVKIKKAESSSDSPKEAEISATEARGAVPSSSAAQETEAEKTEQQATDSTSEI